MQYRTDAVPETLSFVERKTTWERTGNGRSIRFEIPSGRIFRQVARVNLGQPDSSQLTSIGYVAGNLSLRRNSFVIMPLSAAAFRSRPYIPSVDLRVTQVNESKVRTPDLRQPYEWPRRIPP